MSKPAIEIGVILVGIGIVWYFYAKTAPAPGPSLSQAFGELWDAISNAGTSGNAADVPGPIGGGGGDAF